MKSLHSQEEHLGFYGIPRVLANSQPNQVWFKAILTLGFFFNLIIIFNVAVSMGPHHLDLCVVRGHGAESLLKPTHKPITILPILHQVPSNLG